MDSEMIGKVEPDAELFTIDVSDDALERAHGHSSEGEPLPKLGPAAYRRSPQSGRAGSRMSNWWPISCPLWSDTTQHADYSSKDLIGEAAVWLTGSLANRRRSLHRIM